MDCNKIISNYCFKINRKYLYLVSVVHAHKDTTVLEVENFNVLGLRSVGRSESNFEFSGTVNNQIGGFVLITIVRATFFFFRVI